MDFFTFARLHGILLQSYPPIGIWKRYPTEDHPHKRNGAVKFMGTHAFIQNHAMQTEISVWHNEAEVKIDMAKILEEQRLAEARRRKLQVEAANKAAFILKQSVNAKHPYLKSKGFDDEYGNVWTKDKVDYLVVPMRVDGSLVGCQTITPEGEKKFLYGQRTSGAAFTFDNKGPHILCEGYATALSIRAALKAMKRRYTLHVCFSAGNMVRVAETLSQGYVVADNDESKTGENTAKKIGWPFWMSDVVGEDFNDTQRRLGSFKSASSLCSLIRG
jgi:putative DNA primase/helicase